MNHRKHYCSFLMILALGALMICGMGAGCKTNLESGGAYAPTDTNGVPTQQPDGVLYKADVAFEVAYNSIDFIFLFEHQNRASLDKVSPEIHKGIDKLRRPAVDARDAYINARKVYRANPVPANATALDEALARIEQLLAMAKTVMVKNQPQPQPQ